MIGEARRTRPRPGFGGGLVRVSGRLEDMTFLVLVAALFAAPPQDSPVSSTGVNRSQPEVVLAAAGESPIIFPVSLERIRDLLDQPAPVQELLTRRPTFKIEVEEEHHIQQLLSHLDFKDTKVLVPPGGTYNYETQRVMMSALGKPMMQPYAAFNGGELLTLAVEGLIAKYLGWRAINSITDADRARAASAAKAEVARAITDYCQSLPDHGSAVRMCTEAPSH